MAFRTLVDDALDNWPSLSHQYTFFSGFVLFLITVETEIEKLQIELSSIRRLTVELEEGLIELRELQNSNKVFEEEKEDVVL